MVMGLFTHNISPLSNGIPLDSLGDSIEVSGSLVKQNHRLKVLRVKDFSEVPAEFLLLGIWLFLKSISLNNIFLSGGDGPCPAILDDSIFERVFLFLGGEALMDTDSFALWKEFLLKLIIWIWYWVLHLRLLLLFLFETLNKLVNIAGIAFCIEEVVDILVKSWFNNWNHLIIS